MQNDYSVFKIPTLEKRDAEVFDDSNDNYKIYLELNEIAEELEKCRLQTS